MIKLKEGLTFQDSLTIGKLKKFIVELEANWTDQDTKYLGEVTDQVFYVISPEKSGGLDRCIVVNDMHGLLFLPLHEVVDDSTN